MPQVKGAKDDILWPKALQGSATQQVIEQFFASADDATKEGSTTFSKCFSSTGELNARGHVCKGQEGAQYFSCVGRPKSKACRLIHHNDVQRYSNSARAAGILLISASTRFTRSMCQTMTTKISLYWAMSPLGTRMGNGRRQTMWETSPLPTPNRVLELRNIRHGW